MRPPRPVRQPGGLDDRRAGLAAGPDDGPGADARPVVEVDAVRAHRCDPDAQAHLRPRPRSASRGRSRGPCRRTGAAARCRGRPGRPVRGCAEPALRARSALQQLRDRPGGLDAGGAGADHDDVERPARRAASAVGAPAAGRCRCSRSRSASATEYSGNACSAAPGTPKKFGLAPGRDHEVVDPLTTRPSASVRLRSDSSTASTCAVTTSTVGCSAKIVRSGRAMSSAGSCERGHLVEQRLELVVVVAVDQRHVDAFLAELLRAGDPGQAAAEHRRTGIVGTVRSQRHLLPEVGQDEPTGSLDEREV